MPLLDHLIELRQRLFYSLIGFFVAFIVCFFFAGDIFDFLVQPLADIWDEEENRRLIYTALHEKFFTDVKVGLFTAAFVSFPVISIQMWMFMAPGLYRNEKRAFLPFLFATPILFFIGGAFVYYLVLPVAWQFFASFEQIGGAGNLAIEMEPKVNEYLSLVMRLIFAFGISFELPVAVSLLARAGLVTPEGLARNRRYSIVIAFIAAAVLTPPDPISQLSLAVPIIVLYEISIWCAKLIVRGQEARRAAYEAGNDPDAPSDGDTKGD